IECNLNVMNGSIITSIWKVNIDNSFFDDYNPYQDSIHGDWFYDHGRIHHTGEVFLNGKSLWEKESIEKVINPVPDQNMMDPEGSTYTWYCESDEKQTTIWANFHKANPNKELVEISVRRTCFYPERQGINYITIRGFDISQAATQWGAPTAEQIGMISTHWNKGWIIENNVIHDSKCSGITLGKERSTGHNTWSADRSYDGSIHYIEVTFNTLRHGWSKENIGSHIIRNNTIYNCGQTGMCGSMGAAFSIIENNHIYNIWTKRQYSGAEIGGIKFHAAIDATLRKNRIHNCGRGIWLDWMTQGTRVSGNLLYSHDLEDLFLEVNHGPYIVDNNILLSPNSIRNQSQGGAFIHNLITGTVYMWSEPGRFTPYHLSHSTEVAGLSTIYSGDDRYYNNVFVGAGQNKSRDKRYKHGLEEYDKAELPIFVKDNIYYFGARPTKDEKSYPGSSDFNPGVELVEERDGIYLSFNFSNAIVDVNGEIITSEILGKAKVPNARYENPNGTTLTIDIDYFSKIRSGNINPGPFSNIRSGEMKLKVW
ncbi:right-handed parallel beta-helix repeat-containing protein, partial [Bacteroidota bacterium]